MRLSRSGPSLRPLAVKIEAGFSVGVMKSVIHSETAAAQMRLAQDDKSN
jgi:hypothetical protein